MGITCAPGHALYSFLAALFSFLGCYPGRLPRGADTLGRRGTTRHIPPPGRPPLLHRRLLRALL